MSITDRFSKWWEDWSAPPLFSGGAWQQRAAQNRTLILSYARLHALVVVLAERNPELVRAYIMSEDPRGVAFIGPDGRRQVFDIEAWADDAIIWHDIRYPDDMRAATPQELEDRLKAADTRLRGDEQWL